MYIICLCLSLCLVWRINVFIINNNDKSSIHTPCFLYYIGPQFNISCNLLRKDWDAELLERLLVDDAIVECPYISIFDIVAGVDGVHHYIKPMTM